MLSIRHKITQDKGHAYAMYENFKLQLRQRRTSMRVAEFVIPGVPWREKAAAWRHRPVCGSAGGGGRQVVVRQMVCQVEVVGDWGGFWNKICLRAGYGSSTAQRSAAGSRSSSVEQTGFIHK